MKKRVLFTIALVVFGMFSLAVGQTVEAYNDDGGEKKTGLLDPSRFSMNHSVSFGMASGSHYSGLKSQSLYTTMMTYKFSQPVTLNLNFGLPIHSTFSSAHNLSYENLESLDYFKSMPLSASLTWQPSENFAIQVGVMRNVGASYYHNPYSLFNSPFYSPYESLFPSYRQTEPKSEEQQGSKKEKK